MFKGGGTSYAGLEFPALKVDTIQCPIVKKINCLGKENIMKKILLSVACAAMLFVTIGSSATKAEASGPYFLRLDAPYTGYYYKVYLEDATGVVYGREHYGTALNHKLGGAYTGSVVGLGYTYGTAADKDRVMTFTLNAAGTGGTWTIRINNATSLTPFNNGTWTLTTVDALDSNDAVGAANPNE